ncbi:hypothetical protein LCGC14_2363570 [marine sediment metagenome]|uniref:Uncharacterized protein n=1 Tax=marine sediment metagenome TaxID=412755 RepID=A0A0F9C615_9ZZZZ
MLQTIFDRLTGDGGFLRVRAMIALALTGVVAYLFLTGGAVPDDLMKAWFAATAFYFGTRSPS